MPKPIERGDIYWINFNPKLGSEISKRRPAVIVSLSVLNAVRLTIVVVPLSSQGGIYPPLVVPAPSAGKGSNARIDQIRAVDKNRLGKKIGVISPGDMNNIEAALRQILGL